MLAEEGLADIEQAQRELKEWSQELKREVTGLPASVEEGDIVDALDNSKAWRAAKILSKDDKNAVVEFVGWEARWNEPIPLVGGRLKPFRSETNTDTSSSKGGYANRVKSLLLETKQVPFDHPRSSRLSPKPTSSRELVPKTLI
jgi:hypothetical protein